MDEPLALVGINEIQGIYWKDLICNPVWRWWAAILFMAGIWSITSQISRKKPFSDYGIFVFPAVLISLISGLSLISFFLSWSGLISIWAGRLIAFPVVLIGILSTKSVISQLARAFRQSIGLWEILLICFFLVALLPVSDADSISYHLAAPLQILRNGTNLELGLYWPMARIIGSGEYFNLLGVCIGTDVLGALSQWTIFFAVTLSLVKSFPIAGPRWIGLTMWASPVCLFLLTTQKHQLSGTIAIVLASCMTLSFAKKLYSAWGQLLIFTPIFYAASLKYNFILEIGIWGIWYFIFLFYNHRPALNACWKMAFVAAGIWLAPYYLFNWIQYQDPLSPVFHSAKPWQDFVYDLKTNMEAGWPFPVQLFIPRSAAQYTTTLGLLPFLVCMGRCKDFRVKWLWILASLLLIGIGLFSVHASRFLLTPFFILIFSFVYQSEIKNIFIWKGIIGIHALGSIMVLLWFFLSGLPSLFSSSSQTKWQTENAFGFAICQTLDSLDLDPETIVYPHKRYHLFLPHSFIAQDALFFGILPRDSTTSAVQISYDSLAPPGFQSILNREVPLSTRNPVNKRYGTVYFYRRLPSYKGK
jgi:hypothetical protein